MAKILLLVKSIAPSLPRPLFPPPSNSSNNLKRHVAAVHKKSERFPCPHCKFVSYYRDNVRRHIQTVHDENAQVRFQTQTRTTVSGDFILFIYLI